MNAVPECYGKMLPDVSRLEVNRPMIGKAFTALLSSTGMYAQSRSVNVDAEQWQKCIECESYRHCYDLSVGKLLLAHALS